MVNQTRTLYTWFEDELKTVQICRSGWTSVETNLPAQAYEMKFAQADVIKDMERYCTTDLRENL